MEQLSVSQRPLTLQLGRFQLSIPRFRREEPRPDTPDVAEISIDDLDFVRVGAGDTYTLNGRTIRLLGADFHNYPALDNRPPPYTEAMRYKCGPPPEYLSREGINSDTESQARSNVEMPPCYEDVDANANVANITIDVIDTTNTSDIENGNSAAACSITATNTSSDTSTNACCNATSDVTDIATSNVTDTVTRDDTVNDNDLFVSSDTVPETISSVIDNLPAIDSDVNANETLYNNAAIST